MLSRVALENYFSSVDENESYFPTYSQAFAYERYLQEEFSKVLLSNIFAAFLFLSSLPFHSPMSFLSSDLYSFGRTQLAFTVINEEDRE